MNQAILLESNADNIDFMIHGIFSIKVFGQEVWITTSHACILIVMAIMVIFAIVANRKLKKAKEVPDGFQNIIELIVEMLDKMVEGKVKKYYDENCLLNQAFVKDPSVTVGALLKKENSTVLRFTRYEMGEGLEKKTNDFAAEVEAQMKK